MYSLDSCCVLALSVLNLTYFSLEFIKVDFQLKSEILLLPLSSERSFASCFWCSSPDHLSCMVHGTYNGHSILCHSSQRGLDLVTYGPLSFADSAMYLIGLTFMALGQFLKNYIADQAL